MISFTPRPLYARKRTPGFIGNCVNSEVGPVHTGPRVNPAFSTMNDGYFPLG